MLEDLRALIWINFSFSFVSESKNVLKEGIFQFEIEILVAWKVDTKTEYLGPNFDKMERINRSSFLSIPHYFINRRIDLNLVKNTLMESKLLGLNENNSFSNWCALVPSCTPKRDSSLFHTWFRVVKPSRGKIISREIGRQSNPYASSNLLFNLSLSTIALSSFYKAKVTQYSPLLHNRMPILAFHSWWFKGLPIQWRV